MKKLILLAGLLSLNVNAVEQDKILHMGASTLIGGVSQGVTENVYKSSAICMGVGVAKELYDEYDYGGFDGKDLIADAIGCAIGISGVKFIQVYNDRDAYGVAVNFKF